MPGTEDAAWYERTLTINAVGPRAEADLVSRRPLSGHHEGERTRPPHHPGDDAGHHRAP